MSAGFANDEGKRNLREKTKKIKSLKAEKHSNPFDDMSFWFSIEPLAKLSRNKKLQILDNRQGKNGSHKYKRNFCMPLNVK
ncbi:MAG: hypothetical protein LBH16_10585 [Treponema sp.]|jgi:hypothetical protein|nr:hypothetical protein [Treponema sp.]